MSDDPLHYHVDGEVVPAEEATVSARDRGFMYGDAGFETVRVYGGDVFEWEAHAKRLRETCEGLAIPYPGTENLRNRIDETLVANDFEDAYVKVSVSRGVQPGKLTPNPEVDPTVVVYADALPRGGLGSEPVWDDPATLQTVKRRKTPDAALPSDMKTHNYLNSILARLELAEGVDEALLREVGGWVAEGATSNVFFVNDEGLHTPSKDLALLPGITRLVVLDLAREADVPVHTGQYEVNDVREAREAFLTNSTWELRPVASVDGIDVGSGPVTDLLASKFDRLVEERHYADG